MGLPSPSPRPRAGPAPFCGPAPPPFRGGLARSPGAWAAGSPGAPTRASPLRAPTRDPLEVERQVRGDDGNVHEVDHVLVLPPVQVLVDVQALRVRGGSVRPPPQGRAPDSGGLPQGAHPPRGDFRPPSLGRTVRLRPQEARGVDLPRMARGAGAQVRGPGSGPRCRARGAGGLGSGPGPQRRGQETHAHAGTRTSSASRNFPNSRWCRSRMEEPCSLARGFWDLPGAGRPAARVAGRGRGRHSESLLPRRLCRALRGGLAPCPVPSLPAPPGPPPRPPPRLLHLEQVVGAAVVDVVAQAGGDHGEGLQVGVVALQLPRLRTQGPSPAPAPAPAPARGAEGCGAAWGLGLTRRPTPPGGEGRPPSPASRAEEPPPPQRGCLWTRRSSPPWAGGAVCVGASHPAPRLLGALPPPGTVSSVNMVCATLKPWRQLW